MSGGAVVDPESLPIEGDFLIDPTTFLDPAIVNEARTNVRLEASNNITFSDPINI